jgi:hypothetical protein
VSSFFLKAIWELNKLHSSLDVIKKVKLSACEGFGIQYACERLYKVESENLNSRDRSQDLSSGNIQIDNDVGGENMDWLYLCQDRTTVMNFRFP